MDIETKTVRDHVEDYLQFGWKHTEDVTRSGGRLSHTEHVLARDREMPNYRLISALEAKYFDLMKKKRTYFPITDSPECFLLILMLVFPFLIYLAYKSNQKARIAEENAELQRQMDEILKEVKTLL